MRIAISAMLIKSCVTEKRGMWHLRWATVVFQCWIALQQSTSESAKHIVMLPLAPRYARSVLLPSIRDLLYM